MNKRQRKKQIKIHKKHIIKQNKLLVKHYPFLLPRNVFSDKVPSNYNYNFIVCLKVGKLALENFY